MLDDAVKALNQMLSPRLRAVLWKSIGLALALIIAAGIALDRLIVWLVGAGGRSVETTLGPQAHLPATALGWLISIAAGLGIVVGSVMLMPAVTAVVASFFADQIAEEVERAHYPNDPPGVALPLWLAVLEGGKTALLAVAVYICATPFLLFAGFGAIYYWFPKFTGRMMDERLGKAHFWLLFIGFNMTFLVQHQLGLEGMPRRVVTYRESDGFGSLNLISTIGSFIIGVSVLFFAWNLWRSLRHGPPAGNDPWDGQTLEWATTSPPPERNFDSLPPIRSERPFFDQKYGDLVHVHMAGEHLFLISDPRVVRDILVTDQRFFMKGRGLDRAKRLLGEGLLTNEGAMHLRQRRLVQPAFHRERVAVYAEVMARDAGRIGVTEILVGVPFPALAFEVVRFAVPPRYLPEFTLSGATYATDEALRRGWIDEVTEPGKLIDDAIVVAQQLSQLSPAAFAQKQLASVLILNVEASFRKPIDPKRFRGNG